MHLKEEFRQESQEERNYWLFTRSLSGGTKRKQHHILKRALLQKMTIRYVPKRTYVTHETKNQPTVVVLLDEFPQVLLKLRHPVRRDENLEVETLF
jgi:hypothetical protein